MIPSYASIKQRLLRLSSILLCVFVCELVYPGVALALHNPNSTSFTIENDLFIASGEDSYYSDGLRLSFMIDSFDEFNDDNSPRWMRQLFGNMSLIHDQGYIRSSSYGIGQVIVTPADISVPAPQPDDLPYAGLLYGFYTLQGRTDQHAEAVTVLAGIVGPWSLAEDTQKLIHKLTNSQEPQGWDYQLKNEPVVNLTYNYGYLLYSTRWQNQWDMQFLGSGSLYLGNLISGGTLNIVAFLGQQDSYNSLNFRSDILLRSNFQAGGTHRSGFYIFGGTGVDTYWHNIFLDGNSFRDGPSVEKEPYVYHRFLGVGYNWLEYEVHLAWFEQNRLFVGQQGDIEYGSLNFTWRY